jgi:hypothetical protein
MKYVIDTSVDIKSTIVPDIFPASCDVKAAIPLSSHMETSPVLPLSKDTMLILPCSGAKHSGHSPANGQSIVSKLDPPRATALAAARAALREKARVDEKTLMPAYVRYSGQLYEHGSKSIGTALGNGYQIMIVSGGYGLVLANEPIGIYDKSFVLSDWPCGLLEGCLLYHARQAGIRSIVAVMARSSGYAKLVKKVRWKDAGLAAKLISPICPALSGAQGKVPRAQGQAIAALIAAGLSQDWRSSDSLPLEIEDL